MGPSDVRSWVVATVVLAGTFAPAARAGDEVPSIASLETQLVRVRLRVAADSAALPGFEVRADGERLAASSWVIPIPVDQGTHSFPQFIADFPRPCPCHDASPLLFLVSLYHRFSDKVLQSVRLPPDGPIKKRKEML